MENCKVMFSKASDEWSTPQELFDALNAEFHFAVDVAARRENAKCRIWFGPDGIAEDALKLHDWRVDDAPDRIYWMNPPYSRCQEFIAKAATETHHGCTTVCLVPSRTDTRWWHDYVWDQEKHDWRNGVQGRFIKGRVKFARADGEWIRKSMRHKGGTTPNNSAPFPSVLLIFRPL